MAQTHKRATSDKGTTYTDLGNGQFKLSGSATGLLDTISPGNSYYMIYRGSTVPPEEAKFSTTGYDAHLNNVRTLQFKQPDKWWEPIKDYIAPKWNSMLDKIKWKQQGGKLIPTTNNNLLKFVTGYES